MPTLAWVSLMHQRWKFWAGSLDLCRMFIGHPCRLLHILLTYIFRNYTVTAWCSECSGEVAICMKVLLLISVATCLLFIGQVQVTFLLLIHLSKHRMKIPTTNSSQCTSPTGMIFSWSANKLLREEISMSAVCTGIARMSRLSSFPLPSGKNYLNELVIISDSWGICPHLSAALPVPTPVAVWHQYMMYATSLENLKQSYWHADLCRANLLWTVCTICKGRSMPSAAFTISLLTLTFVSINQSVAVTNHVRWNKISWDEVRWD